jgi:hypothetical protein
MLPSLETYMPRYRIVMFLPAYPSLRTPALSETFPDQASAELARDKLQEELGHCRFEVEPVEEDD